MGAHAAGIGSLTVVNIDQTTDIDTAPIEIDLNNDTNTDFIISVSPTFVVDIDSPIVVLSSSIGGTTSIEIDFEVGGFEAGSIRGLTTPGISAAAIAVGADGFAATFEPGEEIGGGDSFSTDVDLYEVLGPELSEGPLAEIGSTVFIGLQLQLFDTNGPADQLFGWLELTRGSVTAGQLGLQTDPNAAAPIPTGDVPLPPSLAMLGAAMAGMGVAGLRRRRA